MGTASYQTYMRCQMRQPSLETQWSLQAVPVPSSNGLDLSLNASRLVKKNSSIYHVVCSILMSNKAKKRNQSSLCSCLVMSLSLKPATFSSWFQCFIHQLQRSLCTSSIYREQTLAQSCICQDVIPNTHILGLVLPYTRLRS